MFENFITAKGNKLFDGEKEFRFVSFNIPNLHICEDPEWHFTTEWEQRDALASIQAMNGKVVRIYTFSVAGGTNNSGGNKRSHILAPGMYDEEVFRYLDKAIQLAHEYGVRLIIPFIDQWSWWGGVKEFAGFYGLEEDCFWTDENVRQGFKEFLKYVINRKNYYTGVRYCDDPAIMAWETGNEINKATDEWTRDISAYIKSLDAKHLLIEGRNGVFEDCLTNPNVDILSSHYYNYSCDTPFVELLKEDLEKVAGRKPFFLGEYGLTYLEDMIAVTEYAVDSACCGTLIWSLRFHKEQGGFYSHSDGIKPVVSRSYHYPGFEENDDYYERDIIRMIMKNAYRVDGLKVPAPAVPMAPVLLETKDMHQLNWKGSVGAEYYQIYRQINDGEWKLICDKCSDGGTNLPLYSDEDTKQKGTYRYYVTAVNGSGISEQSNIICVRAE